jgi:hypothetical protein
MFFVLILIVKKRLFLANLVLRLSHIFIDIIMCKLYFL